MPLIYRAMRADGAKPLVGPTAQTLGVRVPPDPNADIEVGPDGKVNPEGGGMSVAPAWRLLPLHRIPKRLRPEVPGAVGSNSLHCWCMGAGPFTAGPVAAELLLRPDAGEQPRHGVVAPAREMPLSDYQDALAATREEWSIDEG
jgi:hypothetical protein